MVFSRGAFVPKKSCPEPLAPDVASFMKQQGPSVIERAFLNITSYDSLPPVHQARSLSHSNPPLEWFLIAQVMPSEPMDSSAYLLWSSMYEQ